MISVIIIDDEEMISKMLKGYLEDQGFEVATAGTGAEGLGLIRNGQYDVAVIDVRLPDMSGNDLALRAAAIKPGMKFIMHTGSVDYVLTGELNAIGVDADSIIRKPVKDMGEIVRMIERKVPTGRS
ncbi:MAG TPA: response regulator [Spirochaetota bacterium]|nr:response regulator [Spirochaetota bacterium]HOD16164.1 response regulator [Spirochaetota bacterium]HPG49779.1 response regulator [Spirochaetota bacterium]HPN10644.1 response regulator [Spirochaetota bacterium]HQL83619.1 response regulator [Spirochaetota bacterium]